MGKGWGGVDQRDWLAPTEVTHKGVAEEEGVKGYRG